MENQTRGTIFFEVALLTAVVILVEEPVIRAGLAFVPALLLAQRALSSSTSGGDGDSSGQGAGAERREDGIARGHLDQFLKQFRDFYSTCHLLGAGTIDPEEALHRTSRTEAELNKLMADVLAATKQNAGVEGGGTG
jgi:hypothetical protein